MAASRSDISEWFDNGAHAENAYMIVVCDTFDHEDYPVYVPMESAFWEVYGQYNSASMQRIMEVYDLRANKATQMSAGRAWSLPMGKEVKHG